MGFGFFPLPNDVRLGVHLMDRDSSSCPGHVDTKKDAGRCLKRCSNTYGFMSFCTSGLLFNISDNCSGVVEHSPSCCHEAIEDDQSPSSDIWRHGTAAMSAVIILSPIIPLHSRRLSIGYFSNMGPFTPVYMLCCTSTGCTTLWHDLYLNKKQVRLTRLNITVQQSFISIFQWIIY